MPLLPFAGAIACEVVQVGLAVKEDVDRGTTRNTSEACIGAMAGAGGALGGYATGTHVGMMVGGPIGGAVGGFVGATVGCVGADQVARGTAGAVFDRYEYDIKTFKCKSCGKRFKCRVYTGQSRKYCRKCADEDYDFP